MACSSGNIVGAIANEAGIDSKHIGRIDIRDDHSLIDLPEGMPSEIFQHLKKVWVSNQQLRITRGTDKPDFKKAAPERTTFQKREFDKPRKPFFAEVVGVKSRRFRQTETSAAQAAEITSWK